MLAVYDDTLRLEPLRQSVMLPNQPICDFAEFGQLQSV
jgi:hypothetical protein